MLVTLTALLPAGYRLKLLIGEHDAFYERRDAGKHQVDGVCTFLHYPYLDALWQPAP
jgi:hypothetical protein